MERPSVPRQLGYLNRLRVPDEHRDWLVETLTTTPPVRLGRMISMANAAAFLLIAILLVLIAGVRPLSITALVFVPAVVLIGQIPSVVRFRVRQLASTNDLDPPDWAA